MLTILITFATLAVACSTDIVVLVPSDADYRAFTTVWNTYNQYTTSNGYGLSQNNDNVRKYMDVSLSDIVYQGRDPNVKRIDTEYDFRYDNGQWIVRTTTEPTHRYTNTNEKNKHTNVFDDVTQSTEKNHHHEGTTENNDMNRAADDSRTINEQSSDVHNSGDEQQITMNTNNKTIPKHSDTDQSSVKFVKNFDNRTEINNNTKTIDVNTNIKNNTRYDTKTTEDNEVTKSYEVDSGDDRWVWSNGDVETTSLAPLDDRGAFSGDNCPSGKVRINNSCVAPD